MSEKLEKRNREKRKTDPLTAEEWLYFFILPFFTPSSNHRDDHFSESEIDRFKRYGFEKKLKQAYRVKAYGYLFWMVMIFIMAVIVNRWF
ncbi:hypothetical protein [Seonamhaeicola maritimus]|uniref:Uncharacterized protein n=1 Tax=Seonamhaeicola maritimus TaxID=2591822 RepID=A0A5C7GET7_9FLAO|nr:hypothetical protein [Seonamhaeicola maritimus]TXG35616.1 hypothetical protein FUA22_14010 [Seonamhaeicola maritimus]